MTRVQYQHLPSSSRHMYPLGTYFSYSRLRYYISFRQFISFFIETLCVEECVTLCGGFCYILQWRPNTLPYRHLLQKMAGAKMLAMHSGK